MFVKKKEHTNKYKKENKLMELRIIAITDLFKAKERKKKVHTEKEKMFKTKLYKDVYNSCTKKFQ